MGTLGIVYVIAHLAETPTYVTNLVQLIGLGIAVDYSLLIVYRFREELARAAREDDAIVRTMETAGRAVVFSGATVAIGLALLIVDAAAVHALDGHRRLPDPARLDRCRGDAAAGAALVLRAPRDGAASRILARARPQPTPSDGCWARLARSIMRAAGAVPRRRDHVVLARRGRAGVRAPADAGLDVRDPAHPQACSGFDVLQRGGRPGRGRRRRRCSSTPAPAARARARRPGSDRQRSCADVSATRRWRAVHYGPARPLRRPEPPLRAGDRRRQARVRLTEPAQAFVHRLRDDLIPAAGSRPGRRVLAGGGPPQGVDFLDRSYAYFPLARRSACSC